MKVGEKAGRCELGKRFKERRDVNDKLQTWTTNCLANMAPHGQGRFIQPPSLSFGEGKMAIEGLELWFRDLQYER